MDWSAERHKAAEHVLPGAVRVLSRIRWRRDVEPEHQALRGLPVPEHLDTEETTHQAPFEQRASRQGESAAPAHAGPYIITFRSTREESGTRNSYTLYTVLQHTIAGRLVAGVGEDFG